MNRETELALIDELLDLKASKSAFLDEAVARNPVEHYTCDDRFKTEQDKIFRKQPIAIAHVSELAKPGDFISRELGGVPLLITRDKNGSVNAFLNVCRHRGTKLVDAESGCKHRFSCPYHAWTYANTGELLAAPHFEQGFPGEDKADLSLKTVASQERFGFIWVIADPESSIDFDDYFAGLLTDLEALDIENLAIAAENTEVHKANWKILVEGGIEAYHFRVAHRTTIGSHFEDNLSSYQSFGPHLRSILPRTSMAKLSDETRQNWRLRDHANVLYTLFPTCQLLVQQDHIVWVSSEPLSPGETRIRLVTLASKNDIDDEVHWKRNHAITTMTLAEDFEIGESIQTTASSGVNANMLFGRFEGALDQLNRTIESYL